MRTNSTILASLLGLGLVGCASSEQAHAPLEPDAPSEPAPAPDGPTKDDPAYSAKFEQTEFGLELVVRTMRAVDDYELSTPGGDLDVMWRDELITDAGDYNVYELRMGVNPLAALEAVAFHDGNIDLVAMDTLGFEIGSTAFELALVSTGHVGNWQATSFVIGAGAAGFTGTMQVKAAVAPSPAPTANVTADGEVYPVAVEQVSGGYIVRWTQLAMGVCLMSKDCALTINAGGEAGTITMGLRTSAQTTVGPR